MGPSVGLEVMEKREYVAPERSRTPVPLPPGSPLYRLSYCGRNFILKDIIFGPAC
jgi:hypothetical protein